MRIDEKTAVERLRAHDKILFLSHASPDGDTLGSATALCRAMLFLGKEARVRCGDQIPGKYQFMFAGLPEGDFTPDFIVTVDTADPKLLGSLNPVYGTHVDLCIDHHPSNRMYAAETCLDENAAATAELAYALLLLLGAPVEGPAAAALYTGIATDTGCFQYANTRVLSHQIAARLMETGVDAAALNQAFFETKSRARILLERTLLDEIEFYCEGRLAIIAFTAQLREAAGAEDEDFDGVSAIPRQIEGVMIGVVLREKDPERVKVSVRTNGDLDAAALCAVFGGGGHKRAGGCEIKAPLPVAKERVLAAAKAMLETANSANETDKFIYK